MNTFKLILVLALSCGAASAATMRAYVAHERAQAYEDGFRRGYVEGIHEAEAAAVETARCYNSAHIRARR